MDIDENDVTELTASDFDERKPKFALGSIAKIRESHHRMALLFALGYENKEVGSMMGYSESRVSVLRNSPAMVELVARYRGDVLASKKDLLNEIMEQKLKIMLAADRHLLDHFAELDEANELMPAKLALSISADYADRVGYGKHSSQTTAHVDLGTALENAVSRTNKILDAERLKLVGGSESPLPPTTGGGTVTRFRRPLITGKINE